MSFNRNRTGGGNGPSDSPSISADGRFVTYRSSASDLVAEDNNNQPDVFVFDRLTGVNTLVSVNQIGTMSGNGSSSAPVISADGSRIAFRSLASDLIAGDFNNTQDVFISPTPIVTFVDSDGDGMDDAWESARFGDLSHDGMGDTDGDGVSDLAEYKTGTNPTDAASRLSAAATVDLCGRHGGFLRPTVLSGHARGVAGTGRGTSRPITLVPNFGNGIAVFYKRPRRLLGTGLRRMAGNRHPPFLLSRTTAAE